MRALFALTAIAGVQFALMANLGPMAGLLTGAAVCGVTIIVLLAVPIFGRLRADSSTMERLDRIAIRTVFGVLLLCAGTMLAGGGQVLYYVFSDYWLAVQMQRDLGFLYTTESVNAAGSDAASTAITIQAVTNGKAMALAGAAPGDVIVTDKTPQQFLEQLDELRGQSVDITLASGATGPRAPSDRAMPATGRHPAGAAVNCGEQSSGRAAPR